MAVAGHWCLIKTPICILLENLTMLITSIFSCTHNVFCPFRGVLRGSVVKCWTCNLEVLGAGLSGSSGVFHRSVLGEDSSEPQLSTSETREGHE